MSSSRPELGHRRRSTATEYPYNYIRLTHDSHHVRLLTLLPGLPQDAVRVSLSNVALPPTHDPAFPLYESLSYAWGDDDVPTEPIYVEGRVVSARKNLVEALVHLRHHEMPRVMWIDALCINQGDMSERSMQVGRMSDIYSRASRVLVWLGVEDGDSALAMRTLRTLSDNVDLDLATQTFVPRTDEGRDWVVRTNRLPLTGDEVAAVCNLLDRGWFARLWVWQEVRLGNKHTLLVCGAESMSWRRFWLVGFFLLFKRGWGLGEEVFARMKGRLETINAMMNNVTHSTMPSLSLFTCMSLCVEPRDRVYALMGITTDQTVLRPDYSLSVAEVYTDVVVQNLEQAGNLELLSTCVYREERREGLPTWVPEFDRPNTLKRWFDLVSAGEPRADARVVAPGVLEAAGVEVCVLKSLHEIGDGTDDELLDRTKALMPETESLIEYGGAARCRALFANEFTNRYTPAGELLGFQEACEPRRVLLGNERAAEAVAKFAKDLRIQTAGRVFFEAESGHVGLVGEQARAGDVVVHVLGVRWPLVLRRDEEKNGWIVVGFAYVEGANDNEALLGPMSGRDREFKKLARYDAGTGKWWPVYAYNWVNADEKPEGLWTMDPRLEKLPEGWSVKPHKEDKLWNWYVKDGEETEGMLNEMKWRSDPRLSVEALKERGVKMEKYRLV